MRADDSGWHHLPAGNRTEHVRYVGPFALDIEEDHIGGTVEATVSVQSAEYGDSVTIAAMEPDEDVPLHEAKDWCLRKAREWHRHAAEALATAEPQS